MNPNCKNCYYRKMCFKQNNGTYTNKQGKLISRTQAVNLGIVDSKWEGKMMI